MDKKISVMEMNSAVLRQKRVRYKYCYTGRVFQWSFSFIYLVLRHANMKGFVWDTGTKHIEF